MQAAHLTNIPILRELPPPLAEEVARQMQPLCIPAGTVLFDAGSPCQALPWVLEGHIKVSKRASNGREIRLYGVHPGDVCIITLSCLLGDETYPATGVAETEVSALALPRPLFLRLVAEHAPFRGMVFQHFSARMSELMQLVEEVAFRKLDQRLAIWLVARAPQVNASHQAIADELGSVREIISRLLKQFEEQGWVRLGRERVDVLQTRALLTLGEN